MDIRSFFTRILCSPGSDHEFRRLAAEGCLKELLPEVDAMRGVTQPPEFHPEGDVFEHTMVMLHHMVFPDPLLGWSVLLHDIGKPVTRSVESSGRIRFFNHEKAGVEIAEKLLDRLGFDSSSKETVLHAIRNHMRFANVMDMRKSKVVRLLKESTFPLELELHRLDCISCHGKMNGFNFLLEEFLQLPEPEPEMLINGRILAGFGMRPGKEMGELISKIRKLQIAGVITEAEQALVYAQEAVGKFRKNLKDK
ncbi:MAG: HD domain-containing protein [Lentisphaeria bacterium]|nr:HD domain-containing protein [Lentisphaeria bacterium]